MIVGPTLEISGNSKLPRWGMMQHGIRQDCIFCTRLWDGLRSQYGPSVSGLRSSLTTNGKGLSITFGVKRWGFLVMQKLQCIILGTFLAMLWIYKNWLVWVFALQCSWIAFWLCRLQPHEALFVLDLQCSPLLQPICSTPIPWEIWLWWGTSGIKV